MGNELFQRQIERRGDKIMRKVWCPTPFMVDVYTGQISNQGRYREIVDWCFDRHGEQSSPIHGIEGTWKMGGATVLGWTWIGFKTEEMLRDFVEHWPTPPPSTNTSAGESDA